MAANAPLSGELLANSEEGGIGPLSLSVGGFSLPGLKDEQTLSAAQMAKLLPRMLDADAAELSDGKQQWRLSLAGLKAALLRMDEAQGRLGTPGALVKKGRSRKPRCRRPCRRRCCGRCRRRRGPAMMLWRRPS